MAHPTAVTNRTLGNGIGYVRLAFFPGASGQPFAEALDRALVTLTDCDRLIVYLRGNLGGFVGALRLMSYLTPDRVPLVTASHAKKTFRRVQPGQLPVIDRLPASNVEKLAMLIRFTVRHGDRSIRLITEGLGVKPFHGRIVMLIAEHTASAAEMVAGFASERRLVTLVGVQTAGQVLGGVNFRVGLDFTLRLPAAAWHTWEGRMLEGCGVEPGISVAVDPSALAHGEDVQLQAGVDTVATL